MKPNPIGWIFLSDERKVHLFGKLASDHPLMGVWTPLVEAVGSGGENSL